MRLAIAGDPLRVALLFEGGIIPLALLLALLLGVRPWANLKFSATVLVLSVGATALLIVLLTLFALARPGWFREAEVLVRPVIDGIFRGRGPGPVVAVCVLAGVGEELLFRGVLQAWLTGLTGAWPALVFASIVFGLVHYLSRTYFIMAIGIGLYLGALYQLSGNLMIPILVHALYDGLAVAYLLRHSAGPGSGEVH